MKDYEPTSPHDTLSAHPVLSATSGPSAAESSGGAGAGPPPPPALSPDSSASVPRARQARRPRVRRLLSNKKSGRIEAAALMCAVIGLTAGCATSPSAPATSPSATTGNIASGSRAAGGGGSNARSGPAAGGSSGTVDSVSTSSFTMTTPAGQQVTVNEASSTTYQKGTSSTSASAVKTGEPVLVLGTASGTTITATQVIVQPPGSGGSAASSAAGVIPFQPGAPTTSKQVGQIPANYSQGREQSSAERPQITRR